MIYSTIINFLLLSTVVSSLHAQGLAFSVALDDGGDTWTVYFRAVDYQYSGSGYLSSGQITIKVSTDVQLMDFESVNGLWRTNAPDIVRMPIEAPGYSYYSIGLDNGLQIPFPTTGTPEIPLVRFAATDCPDALSLLHNPTDPFNKLPNSAGNNPGNTLTLIDNDYQGSGLVAQIDWLDNYATDAWNCNSDGANTPVVIATPALLQRDGLRTVDQSTNTIRAALPFEWVVGPNPTTSNSYLTFTGTVPADLRIRLYDMRGTLLRTVSYAGESRVRLPLDELGRGHYLVTLSTTKGKQSRKLIRY